MNISIDWLKEFVDIEDSAEDLAEKLTMSGLEVEGIKDYEPVPGGLKGLVVGEVMECEKHPDADKLKCTKVDVGEDELLSIVCGAPNVDAGQKVVVATVGTTLYPEGGDPFKIKKSKIRGQLSQGMICAEDEIGLGENHDGIMVLKTELPNGTPAAEHFNLKTDKILEIGLTPNRIDAASHYGVAREVGALYKKDLEFPTSGFMIDSRAQVIEVEVENTEACPRYTGVTITNVKVKESPEWLQRRLKSIGLAPINNVVDITNYILHGLGQPLHAFDADKIAGNKVVVRTCEEGTPFVTLDGEERKLAATDLMICDEEKPMCIAGVFGGLNSGVTESTTTIFLESAYFDAAWVRKTSQKHGLKTDASFRFERGTDPNMTEKALKVATLLIKKICGGQVSSDIQDIYPKAILKVKIDTKYKNIDRLIGKVIDRQEIKGILERLDIEVISEDEAGIKVLVPPYRVDVQREADVIEEILRIYGVNNVELSEEVSSDYLAEFPAIDTHDIQKQVTEMLAASGCHELMTNSITSSKYADLMDSVDDSENVEILNMLTPELDALRQSLIFSGLEVIAYNINRKQKDLKLFEFGKVYQKKGGEYTEAMKLGIFVTGNQLQESWRNNNQPADYHTIATLVQKVLQKVRIETYTQKHLDEKAFSYGISVSVNDHELVKVGLLNPKLAKAMDIKQSVFYAEVDWAYILKKFSSKRSYEEISKFPEVRRDLSLVMDTHVSFDSIKTLAFETERKLLQSINVFDTYEGENLGEGKKSYSVSFFLQDKKKTLEDKQIDKSMNRLMNAFEEKLNILIRK